MGDQKIYQLLERIAAAVEKIADKKLEFTAKPENWGKVRFNHPAQVSSLSQWRVSSLKRIEKACGIIDTLLEHPIPAEINLIEPEGRKGRTSPKPDVITITTATLKHLRKTLMENE